MFNRKKREIFRLKIEVSDCKNEYNKKAAETKSLEGEVELCKVRLANQEKTIKKIRATLDKQIEHAENNAIASSIRYLFKALSVDKSGLPNLREQMESERALHMQLVALKQQAEQHKLYGLGGQRMAGLFGSLL